MFTNCNFTKDELHWHFFFLILTKSIDKSFFRWLLLFIAFTQNFFTEKVCFIETNSFNYSFIKTSLINPTKSTLLVLGGHSLLKQDVMSYLSTALLSWDLITLKKTSNSYFCVTPQNNRLMFFSRKILKSTVTKKVIVYFHNLGEENF